MLFSVSCRACLMHGLLVHALSPPHDLPGPLVVCSCWTVKFATLKVTFCLYLVFPARVLLYFVADLLSCLSCLSRDGRRSLPILDVCKFMSLFIILLCLSLSLSVYNFVIFIMFILYVKCFYEILANKMNWNEIKWSYTYCLQQIIILH